MKPSLRSARLTQTGFWLSGLAFLLITYKGWFGLWGIIISLSVCTFFHFAVMTLKCSQCCVSYFFDPLIASWNMGGINLFRPVKGKCPKCGAKRSGAI